MAAVDFFSNQVRTPVLSFIGIKSPARRLYDMYGKRKMLWYIESTSFIKLLWSLSFICWHKTQYSQLSNFNLHCVTHRTWKDPNRSSSSKHSLQQHQTHLTTKWWQAVPWYCRVVQGDSCSRLFLLEFLQNVYWSSDDVLVGFFCKSTSMKLLRYNWTTVSQLKEQYWLVVHFVQRM